MIYAINHYAYASQLTYSQAANFFHQFVATLSAEGLIARLGIPASNFNTLKGLDGELTDYVSRTRKSAYTAQMQTYDALRKAMFDSLWYLLYALKSADTDAKKATWQKVSDIVSTYPIAIKGLDYSSVTARLRGFLADVRKLDTEELAANAFVSAAMLKALEDANEAFDKAFLDRNTERTDLKKVQIQNILANITAMMKLICAMIEVKANEEVTDQNADAVTAAQKAVGDINENIEYYYSHYMKSGKGRSEDDSTGDDIDPNSGSSSGSNGSSGSSSDSNGSSGSSSGSGSGSGSGGSTGGGSSYVL
jgi:hypothetical protein